MVVLSAEALLAVWETSYHRHPIVRALAVLDAAWPNIAAGDWARAPIGQRDCGLLGLQESLFGTELSTTTPCPRCAERLETTFRTTDVRVRAPSAPAAPSLQHLRAEGYEIEYRLPTSEDLLEIAASELDTQAATRELLRRCVVRVEQADRAIDPTGLPPPVLAQLGDEMTREDPEADIRLRLTCPACGHAFRVAFDIVSYFWSEVEDWAHRVLVDIHTLAAAYGWSERQILALTPMRRQLYVDMVRA